VCRCVRRGGTNLTNIAALSITFLQLFSLFFFSVDSQWFIAEDFFSIASNKRGEQRVKRQFQLIGRESRRESRRAKERIKGEALGNLFTILKEYNQHTREAIASKHRMSSVH
jgi:hypothetical protein